MAFSATQYLFEALTVTATTTATVGAYVVPASTRGMVTAVTVANTATSNAMNYVDVELFNGTSAYNVTGAKTPIYPGGSLVVEGVQQQVLPSGGAVYITTYATTPVDIIATIIEIV